MAAGDLFRSDQLAVRLVRGARAVPAEEMAGTGTGGVCFVTFASYTNDPSLDRQGFGEDFLRGEGWDAVHVLTRDNLWYHHPELPAALAAAAAAAGGHARILTYGSSMGGYAALRFARAVGADTAIAISPQFSLDPRIVPFENRWQADAARIAFAEAPYVPPPRCFIFHDPRLALDAAHVRLFVEQAPGTVAVGIPHGGHPVGAILAETGALKAIVRDIVADRFDPATVQRAVRARRRGSQHHYFMLSRRAGGRRPDLRIALLRRAAAIEPESHILSELATMLDARGAHEEAAVHHSEAIRRVPGNARARIAYARHLEMTGDRAGARALLAATLSGLTGSVRLLVRTEQLRMALRRWHLGAIDRAIGRRLAAARTAPGHARITRWLGRMLR